MLQPLLQEYLIEKGNLPLPKRGLLTIDYEPAYLQKADNRLVAPTSDILFMPLEVQESEIKNLVSFLSRKLNISFDQANDLLMEENVGELVLKEMGNLITWPDAGNVRSKHKQQVNASPTVLYSDFFTSFPIEKIYRQPVTSVQLGTQPAAVVSEETYPEYEEAIVKDYWWVWAIAIFVISALLIVLRYYQQPNSFSS